MSDIIEMVQKATEKGTFSVLDAIEGTAYPEDFVDVYTDVVAAFQIARLEREAADEKDPDVVDQIDAKINEYKERLKNTSLRFYLRGYSPEIIKAINDQAKAEFEVDDTETGEVAHWCNFKYVAEAIQRVERPDGSVDSHHWSVEELEALAVKLPEGQFDRVAEKMAEVVFVASYFDRLVDADF